jgi:dienelactone hydrolase
MITRPSIASALAAAWLVVAASPLAAQQRDAILILQKSDTFSVERFARTPTRLESELVVKAAAMRINLTVTLGANGGAEAASMAVRQASADRTATPMQSAAIRFQADSVFVDIAGGAGKTTQRFVTRPGAIPYLNPSFALVELAIAKARAMGRDTAMFMLQGGATVNVKVIRVGQDSVAVDFTNVVARLAVSSNGEIVGGEIPSQNLRVVRVRGMGEAAMAVAKPDYSAPPGAPYTAIEVTVPTTMGHTLAGTLTMPKNAKGRVPAMVTITGSGQEDRDEAIPIVKGYRPFRDIADTLAYHGIAVLRMDDRGFGASGGDASKATSADFADDIRAGLAYLRTRADIDGGRLGLIGHSEGGLIAPMVAATDGALRGIVLMAGPSKTGRVILAYQQQNAIDHDTSLTGAKRDSALRRMSIVTDSLGAAMPWMHFFLDYDPLATARKVRVPTLILQGMTDQQVTRDQAEGLARALREGGNRRVTVRLFPEANHLFVQDPDGDPAKYTALPSRALRRDVKAAIVDWLIARMQ